MTKDMSISARASAFCELLQKSEVTKLDGERLALEAGVQDFCQMLLALRNAKGNLYIVGNGGSASVASHAVTDFMNVAKLKASTLHEPSLLTCMSNDYKYENAYARMISMMVEAEDVVIAISSSGSSLNIRNAALEASKKGAQVVTFSGFDADTPLRSMGALNFWIESRDYGFVELGHQFLLHNTSDRLKES